MVRLRFDQMSPVILEIVDAGRQVTISQKYLWISGAYQLEARVYNFS